MVDGYNLINSADSSSNKIGHEVTSLNVAAFTKITWLYSTGNRIAKGRKAWVC
jgi:hypothetical protein